MDGLKHYGVWVVDGKEVHYEETTFTNNVAGTPTTTTPPRVEAFGDWMRFASGEIFCTTSPIVAGLQLRQFVIASPGTLARVGCFEDSDLDVSPDAR